MIDRATSAGRPAGPQLGDRGSPEASAGANSKIIETIVRRSLICRSVDRSLAAAAACRRQTAARLRVAAKVYAPEKHVRSDNA